MDFWQKVKRKREGRKEKHPILWGKYGKTEERIDFSP
jgi:hypothetical protein